MAIESVYGDNTASLLRVVNEGYGSAYSTRAAAPAGKYKSDSPSELSSLPEASGTGLDVGVAGGKL
jgi:hypothetical protein